MVNLTTRALISVEAVRLSENLLSAPAADLFPNYPPRREKYQEELNYALLIAVCSNHCPTVEVLLEAGANVSHFSEWYPMLMRAVDNLNGDVVKVLLRFGSDPNTTRLNGSGLHAIARRVHSAATTTTGDVPPKYTSTDIAQILIEAGADVNLKNESEDSTPLHEAVKYGNAAAVEFFVHAGADVNARDKYQRTPLHWAVQGSLALVQLLLDKGACPLAVDENSNAPWMLAMQKKLDSVARLLCSFHDVNATDANGRTPLHMACAAGCAESVQVLLKEGANFNAVDNDGNTPLMDAVRGKPKVVEMLLACPYIDIARKNKQGQAAIHFAVDRLASTTPNASLGAENKFSKPAMKVVNQLLAKGADVNMKGVNGETPVVKHVNNEVVFKFLIAAGADVNVIAADGDNALKKVVMVDFYQGTWDKTEKLLQHNVDVARLSRSVCDNLSALHCAVESKEAELAKLLLHSGAETSHLTSWLQNTERGQAVKNSMAPDMQALLKLNCNGTNLMETARSAVLRHLGHRNVPDKIKGLEIPKSLQKYLTHDVYLLWRNECV